MTKEGAHGSLESKTFANGLSFHLITTGFHQSAESLADMRSEKKLTLHDFRCDCGAEIGTKIGQLVDHLVTVHKVEYHDAIAWAVHARRVALNELKKRNRGGENTES